MYLFRFSEECSDLRFFSLSQNAASRTIYIICQMTRCETIAEIKGLITGKTQISLSVMCESHDWSYRRIRVTTRSNLVTQYVAV